MHNTSEKNTPLLFAKNLHGSIAAAQQQLNKLEQTLPKLQMKVLQVRKRERFWKLSRLRQWPFNTNSICLVACKAGILILSNSDFIETLFPRGKKSYCLVSTTGLQIYESLIATKPYQSFFSAWQVKTKPLNLWISVIEWRTKGQEGENTIFQ